jgi:hypothetical protein
MRKAMYSQSALATTPPRRMNKFRLLLPHTKTRQKPKHRAKGVRKSTVNKNPEDSDVLPIPMEAQTASAAHNRAAHFLKQNRPTPTTINVEFIATERTTIDIFQNRGGSTIGFHSRNNNIVHSPMARKITLPKPAL